MNDHKKPISEIYETHPDEQRSFPSVELSSFVELRYIRRDPNAPNPAAVLLGTTDSTWFTATVDVGQINAATNTEKGPIPNQQVELVHFSEKTCFVNPDFCAHIDKFPSSSNRMVRVQ